MCTRSCARRTLFAINFLFFALGVTMIVLGGYAINAADKLGDEIAPVGVMRLAVAAGALITMTSFMGCCGAWKNGRGCWRYVLLGYAAFLLVIIVVQFIGVGIVYASLHRLDDLKGQPASDEGDDQWERSFDRAVNRTFTTCCLERNATDLCTWLQDHTTHDCGNFTEFRDGIITLLDTRLRPLGGSLLGFGIVEVLCLFAACGLFWKRPRDEEERDGAPSGAYTYGTSYSRHVARA